MEEDVEHINDGRAEDGDDDQAEQAEDEDEEGPFVAEQNPLSAQVAER